MMLMQAHKGGGLVTEMLDGLLRGESTGRMILRAGCGCEGGEVGAKLLFRT